MQQHTTGHVMECTGAHRSSAPATQVLAMLGCVEGKRVVELGAGIGRFTGCLAATARNLLAVDFMDNLIQENRRANSHRHVPRRLRCFIVCGPQAFCTA